MGKKSENGLTVRTPGVIGREDDLERLRKCLRARGENHYVYFWAHGGLGKTRLLEELQKMVEEAGPGFYSTGIIDLYHTDTHSTSDLERAIVEGLDPECKYFTRYRQERHRYELLRERGTDPGVLERRRGELSQIFINECREMSVDARKLVICFDTVELLQYESSAVEEMAGLDTMDARVKPWLLRNLPQLANVLVVFAGRPKRPVPGERIDPQARLVADLERAFGEGSMIVELQPFTFEETRAFIEALSDKKEIIPAQYLPVVHRLTGGRPILLHLVVDLIRRLSPEPRAVVEMFDQYADLVDAPDDDGRLTAARVQIEVEISSRIVKGKMEMGGLLGRLALMPKGVDAEILHQALGMPRDEAEEMLALLEPLSFVKRHKAPPGAERLHVEHTFLHDEMYWLLTRPSVMLTPRLDERQVAHSLEMSYYDPRIARLERELAERPPEERVSLRERLQKLQVERMYYILARDVRQGYAEYKLLSDQANRRRWVGFGMRVLDEFLRFYNTPELRKRFEDADIPYERVIRESAQMWVERFHWWGQREREEQFAHHILDQPGNFLIRPEEDLAILGNVCALWARARALRHGYEPEVVREAQEMLGRLPALVECTSEQALARARLSTSIGFQLALGGLLVQAAAQYVDAKAAFRKLEGYLDELAMLLNNLAFVYARQGRMTLARSLAHEALRINEEMGSDYSTGLTLSTLATIARMRGNYYQAILYSREALALFRELEESHGTVLAYRNIAQATRRMAKHELEKGRSDKLEEARRMMVEAQHTLDTALKVAEDAGLGADVPMLIAEQGRVYRELGHVVRELEGLEEGLVYYRQGEGHLRSALEATVWGEVEQADIVQDLAEVLFFSGDSPAARKYLAEIEEMLGSEHHIVPGEHLPDETLPREPFAPLGKVEMTRGQMAFAEGRVEEGIQHYMLAYAYLMRFSPDAVEKDALLDYLYKRLRDIPVERQRVLMESVRVRARQQDTGVDISSFVQTLEDLLGV
jgi:tetratricopeptide (TPR) repeat protein